ncbi:MAG: oligosaccharide flippase family protein [Pseudomonadota bacterium]
MSVWENLRAQLPQRGKLSGRAARASIWSMGELGLSYGLRLGSNLIMTRILLPEAFGLMAMVTTVHFALSLLSDLGIGQSIIRSPRGDDPHYLRVAWTIQVVRSTAIAAMVLVVAGLLWLLAPTLAMPGTVYADPNLPALIAVSSVVLVLSGLESTSQYIPQRQMRLKWVTILNIAGQVVALVAMVGIAQIDASVWSLLWGMIIGAVFRSVMTHVVFSSPSMAIAWDREIADDFWQFGKWIIASSMTTFFAAPADKIFLGAMLDKEHFGFYVIASIWVQSAVMVTSRITAQIGLPLFSDVSRERPHDLLRVYQRFTRLIGLMAMAAFVALFLGGAALLNLLYPDSYAQAASFIPFLALALLGEWFSPLAMLLLSQGNSRAEALSGFAKAFSIILALPVGFYLMGIEGALLAVAVAPLGGLPPLLVIAHRTLGLPLRPSFMIIGATLAVAAAVGIFLNPLP